jgi:2-oxoglutarate dehydrogenase E1 component
MEDLSSGKFQTVIPEGEQLDAGKVSRVIVCSGKVYYDLVDYRRENKIADKAVIRLEQQYPFPHADFKAEIAKYPQATEVVWCQEEPQNQGAWYRLRAYLRADIDDRQLLAYAGRPISASPAVGYMSKHVAQQEQLVRDAFTTTLASGEMVTAH